jgi:alpha-mannosidase
LGIEFPAQNWAAYGDGTRGLAVLNRGLPGNLVSEDALVLSLMRSTCIVAYGFGGGYEPGMSSDTGFEQGVERCFEYSLVGYQGDWRRAQLYRRGWELNHTLVVRKATPHPGPLPARWGWLEVSAPNVVISALKPGPDGSTILRVYEAEGQATPEVTVLFHAKVRTAEETDLLEGPGRRLTAGKKGIRFGMRGFEVKTLRLRLQA